MQKTQTKWKIAAFALAIAATCGSAIATTPEDLKELQRQAAEAKANADRVEAEAKEAKAKADKAEAELREFKIRLEKDKLDKEAKQPKPKAEKAPKEPKPKAEKN